MNCLQMVSKKSTKILSYVKKMYLSCAIYTLVSSLTRAVGIRDFVLISRKRLSLSWRRISFAFHMCTMFVIIIICLFLHWILSRRWWVKTWVHCTFGWVFDFDSFLFVFDSWLLDFDSFLRSGCCRGLWSFPSPDDGKFFTVKLGGVHRCTDSPPVNFNGCLFVLSWVDFDDCFSLVKGGFLKKSPFRRADVANQRQPCWPWLFDW